MKNIYKLFAICMGLSFSNIAQTTVASEQKGVRMTNTQENSCLVSNESKHLFAVIDTHTLKTLIQSKTSFILLDARSAKWDDGKRIPGAKSLTSESSTQDFAKLIPRKESLIVVYCSNLQCGASERLAKRLNELGYASILKYAEGIEEWIHQGNPIVEMK